jgi:hypothetical protein
MTKCCLFQEYRLLNLTPVHIKWLQEKNQKYKTNKKLKPTIARKGRPENKQADFLMTRWGGCGKAERLKLKELKHEEGHIALGK